MTGLGILVANLKQNPSARGSRTKLFALYSLAIQSVAPGPATSAFPGSLLEMWHQTPRVRLCI